jgi:hypothetical protein
LGFPFRLEKDGPSNERIIRSSHIAAEIRSYITAAADLQRKADWQRAGLVPERFQEDIVRPELPNLLLWLYKVDQYGFPLTGTFLDQPAEFLEDIDAARLAADAARKAVAEQQGDQDLSAEAIQRKIDAFFAETKNGR